MGPQMENCVKKAPRDIYLHLPPGFSCSNEVLRLLTRLMHGEPTKTAWYKETMCGTIITYLNGL